MQSFARRVQEAHYWLHNKAAFFENKNWRGGLIPHVVVGVGRFEPAKVYTALAVVIVAWVRLAPPYVWQAQIKGQCKLQEPPPAPRWISSHWPYGYATLCGAFNIVSPAPMAELYGLCVGFFITSPGRLVPVWQSSCHKHIYLYLYTLPQAVWKYSHGVWERFVHTSEKQSLWQNNCMQHASCSAVMVPLKLFIFNVWDEELHAKLP